MCKRPLYLLEASYFIERFRRKAGEIEVLMNQADAISCKRKRHQALHNLELRLRFTEECHDLTNDLGLKLRSESLAERGLG